MDVWHRGTALNLGTSRRVVNLAYARKDCHHWDCWSAGFSKTMYYEKIEKQIVKWSPLQRSVIGFPSVEDNFWKDEERKKWVQARYPGMDLSVYRK